MSMPSWETIHDSSSHFSKIKLDNHNTYSTENNDIFQGVSKSFIPSTTSAYTRSKKELDKTVKKTKMIPYLRRGILSLLVLITSGLIAWSCSKTGGYCLGTTTIENIDLNSIRYKLYEYNNEMLSPVMVHAHKYYDWMSKTDLKTAYKTVVQPIIYDGSSLRIVGVLDWTYRTGIQPLFETVQQKITRLFLYWKKRLDDYVNNPQYIIPYDGDGNGEDGNENDEIASLASSVTVEDNIRKTAKRILDYVDQINRDSVRTGMRREEAKKKAHDIIREITHPNKLKNEEEEQTYTEDDKGEEKPFQNKEMEERDMSKVAFEIREILKVSQHQRLELEEHLSLIQSYLSPSFLDQEDPDLLASALKSEIDRMRQEAEDQVRARTKQALDNLKHLFPDTIMSRVKDDIHSAQRVALRDLRQVYRNIYQVNENIDNLFNQGSSV